ncbi:hypothetical protein D3C80_1289640 [compost metagenome]
MPRGLKTKLLLVLQWAHAGDIAEMLAKRRGTHMGAGGQLVHGQRSVKVELEPGHDLGDLLARRTGRDQVPEVQAMGAGE